MNIIARAAVYIYDGSAASPIFPEKPGKPADETGAYLSAIAEKLMTSDTSRTTCVEPGSAQEELLRRFGYTPFGEAADALMRGMDESMQALEIPRSGFDMAIFSFDKDNDPHLCVVQLPYRRAMVHQVENGDEGLSTEILEHGFVLPLAGSKAYSGFVVNLSTGDIRLRDAQVLTNVGNRMLFSEALFAMAQTRTTKESVQVVTEMIAQAAPPEMTEQELRPAVKRAMAKSIEEKGVIDVQDVAQEVFRSDPEREAIVEEVSRQMQEEAVAPVIPVENKRVMTQLQKLKIKTDNGISITLPRMLADDENSFAVVSNDDGTISIIISRVQELKTE
ncbi:MAG: nucleoid-associated protein [Clostridia bacterium]|nr:nucleoid-associated protein [Clostridia bacterium]MBQ7053055.1 nucleoid-associated protein [Clostridia bacterium]